MSSPRDIKMNLPDGGRIPRVGKLRLGVKVERMKNDKPISFPSGTDYFVVNEDASTNRQSAESFHDVYGDEPRELDIVLPAPRTEDVLEGAWRMYGTGGKLKCKCSGPGGECVQRGDDGEWIGPDPCACEAKGVPLEVRNQKGELVKNPNHCAQRWTLTVMLMRVAGVGCWQLDTGSVMAAEGLTASLRMLEQFRGHLQGAKATLRVVPRQVAPGGKAKTVHIVELGSLDITPQQALELASGNAKRVALPASTLDDEPDALLDGEQHEQIEAAAVEVEEPQPYSISRLLKEMSAFDRNELYDTVGITAPAKASDVLLILRAELDRLDMPDNPQPDPAMILALHRRNRAAVVESDPQAVEAFQRFADTGEDLDAGDQATLDAEALA